MSAAVGDTHSRLCPQQETGLAQSWSRLLSERKGERSRDDGRVKWGHVEVT